MPDNQLSETLTPRQQIVGVAIVAALIGLVFAPMVYGATADTADTVAVVEMEGPVDAFLADDVEAELTEIRNNDSVEAVVLKIDTSGGAPVASERMYASVQKTAEEMPVIASVQDMSASGGYYAMAPADEIYVLPTSIVGSIGLNAMAPQPTPPTEGPSGPDKTGSNKIETWAQQQTLADTFVNAMMEERGDEFEMTRDEVAHADVYLGTEAIHNGFADEIGSLDEAVHEAADRADLDEYNVDTRETGLDGGIPILIRTDDQIVAVYDNDPGYAEVEPMEFALVHQDAVPHVDTIERFAATDLRTDAEPITDETNDETETDGEDDSSPAISGGTYP